MGCDVLGTGRLASLLSTLINFPSVSVIFQGLAFLRKDICDVREIEFAKAVRVTHTTMEQVSFTVPRVKVCGIFHWLSISGVVIHQW